MPWFVRGRFEQENQLPDPVFYNIHLCKHDAVFHGPYRWQWLAQLASWLVLPFSNGTVQYYVSQDDKPNRLLTPGGDDYWKWLEGYEKVKRPSKY